MRYLIIALLLSAVASITFASSEGCIENEENDCGKQTEYNKYIECMHEKRRHKRSLGCSEGCEFTNCNECQNTCQPNCPECGICSSSCRQCCSEVCTSNLCCHKTCHNQCKTNHCRTECKKECKDRVSDGSTIVNDNKQNSTNVGAHNITTIINLHNIINNTNVIDIPIKINNTNFNNITLQHSKRSDVNSLSESAQLNVNAQGNKCCYVIGPKLCNKTSTFPFLRCFHYRYYACGSFCVSTVVHVQEQQHCDEKVCRNRYIYVPEPQSRCFYQPTWPFVSCAGQNPYHHCQGCYAHYVDRTQGSHLNRCRRCYDDGYGMGPYYRQGPFYQPGYSHVPSCLQVGYCQYAAAPAPPVGYPGYSGYPGYGYSNYGYLPLAYPAYNYPGYYGYQGQYYTGYDPNAASASYGQPGSYQAPVNLGYPTGPYVFNTDVYGGPINGTHLLASNDVADYQQDASLKIDFSTPPLKTSRYAVIAIDANKAQAAKKEKRVKKRADKEKSKEINKEASAKVTKKPVSAKSKIEVDLTEASNMTTTTTTTSPLSILTTTINS